MPMVKPSVACSSGLSPTACKISTAIRRPRGGFDCVFETSDRIAASTRTIHDSLEDSVIGTKQTMTHLNRRDREKSNLPLSLSQFVTTQGTRSKGWEGKI